MYLLVFVVLVIGLVGVYGQILSLQAARIAASMNGFATTMAAWHGGALSMASGIITAQGGVPGMAGYTMPCSLTYAQPVVGGAALARCTPGPVPPAKGTVTSNLDAPHKISASGELVHLPPGYNYADDQFYSIFYADAAKSHFYVVTFVLPPTISAANPAPGFVSLPPPNKSLPPAANRLISYTLNDLYHQLTISGLPDFSYGTALSNLGPPPTSVLISPWFLEAYNSIANIGPYQTFQYNLPISAGNVPLLPTGTVAIVSSPP